LKQKKQKFKAAYNFGNNLPAGRQAGRQVNGSFAIF